MRIEVSEVDLGDLEVYLLDRGYAVWAARAARDAEQGIVITVELEVSGVKSGEDEQASLDHITSCTCGNPWCSSSSTPGEGTSDTGPEFGNRRGPVESGFSTRA